MLYGILIDLKFILQLNHMKISIFPLNKVIIDAFDIDKMLYGILIFLWQFIWFICIIHIENDYWKSSGYSEIKLMLKH